VSVAVLAAAEVARPGVRLGSIPRMTWHEAMERYGCDKPDLRFGMELVELTEVFGHTDFRAFAGADAVKGIRVEGEAEMTRSRLDALTERAKALGRAGLVSMRVRYGGLFEETDDAGGAPAPMHHPFTMPHPDDIDRLESDPLSVRAQAYDLVLNGWELGSGSVRIHRSDVQQRIFSLLGLDAEAARQRFG